MNEWLRSLKRRWRSRGGREIFERLRRARTVVERHRAKQELAERILPPDATGWSRYYLGAIAAMARQARDDGPAPDPEAVFNRLFLEFAMAYRGLVPNNVPPGELGAFAAGVASRLHAGQRTA
jgi:hypothetical protein